MNLEKSESQQLLATSVRDFAEKKIRPYIMKWDETQSFPIELFKEMGKMGYMGALVPEKFGGAELSYFEYVSLIEEISKVDPAIGLSVAAHNSLCTSHILSFGNETQKKQWLPRLASGSCIGAWALTETVTGSDTRNMSTTALRDGNEWLFNGTKSFITHAISAKISVIIARTGEKNDSHGMTAFVVEKGTPGLSGGRKLNKLGMRASETAELILNDCRIPDSQRLGEIGEGLIQAMKILDGGRISIAALSLGIAKGAFEAALKYAQERKQFGQFIGDFQAIGFKLAEMATEIEAAELLIYKACDKKQKGQPMSIESAMCKYYTSEACVRIANEAVQIFGGYGYTKDFPVEKFYRDAKLCTIGEGTTEIQKLVISKKLMKSIHD
ncbi:MAG: acyl-CoA dehydrogenase family protein [Flavobacteriales bacterium Tduv]